MSVRPDRSYVVASTAWPRDIWQRGEERMAEHLMLRVVEGDLQADLGIEWLRLRPGAPPCPRLRAFGDAWQALPLIAPVLADLGDRAQPTEVIAALEGIGFVPDRINGQIAEDDRRRDRLEFDRLRRERPEWFTEAPS